MSPQLQDFTERIAYIQQLTNTDGLYQSPIDLNIKDKVDIDLPDLEWYNYGQPPTKMKMCNNGHTMLVTGSWRGDDRPLLTGGPFAEDYTFSQMHFHWGETDEEGSEHTIENMCCPLELHVVHFKATYASQQEAMEQKDGLVVAVYFFNIEENCNERMNPLTNSIDRVSEAFSWLRMEPLPLDTFFDPFECNYFMYWGSVTTETCNHRVLWLICREPMGISQMQLAAFRTLCNPNGAPIRSNLNFVQPMNTRSLFLVNGKKPLDRTLMLTSPASQLPLRALASTPITESASEFWPFQTLSDTTDIQSPIDIPFSDERRFAPLTFTNLFKPKGEAFMKNDGSTVLVTLTGREPLLEGGPLRGTYKFVNVHFHWSKSDTAGTEHSIRGKKFAVESHCMFMHVKSRDMNMARKMENGIVVVANLYEVNERPNEDLLSVIENIHKIKYPFVETEISTSFFSVFRNNFESGYYTYPGSLTTNRRSKPVTWILYPETIPIGRSQVAEFRQILDDQELRIDENVRPMQDLNNREVYFAC